MSIFSASVKHKPYYRKGYYKENLTYKYSDGEAYLKILESFNEKTQLITSAAFSLFNTTYPSQSEIKKQLGKPANRIKLDFDKIKSSIDLYRHYIGGYKVRSEYHFHNGELFYFNHQFNHIDWKEKSHILQTLQSKYLDGKSFDPDSQIIAHQKGHFEVSITENIGLSIEYLLLENSDFFDRLKAQLNSEEMMKKKKSLRVLNDLYTKI